MFINYLKDIIPVFPFLKEQVDACAMHHGEMSAMAEANKVQTVCLLKIITCLSACSLS